MEPIGSTCTMNHPLGTLPGSGWSWALATSGFVAAFVPGKVFLEKNGTSKNVFFHRLKVTRSSFFLRNLQKTSTKNPKHPNKKFSSISKNIINWRSIDFCQKFPITFPPFRAEAAEWRSAPSNFGEPLAFPHASNRNLWSKNSQHSQVFQKTRIHIEFTNRVNIITLESTSLSVIFFWAIFWYDFCSSTLQLRGSNHLKGKLGGAIVITCTAQLNHIFNRQLPPKIPNLSHGHGYGGTHLKIPNKNHHLISTWRHGSKLIQDTFEPTKDVQVPLQQLSHGWVLPCSCAPEPPQQKRASARVICVQCLKLDDHRPPKKHPPKIVKLRDTCFFWSVPPFRAVSFSIGSPCRHSCIILTIYEPFLPSCSHSWPLDL